MLKILHLLAWFGVACQSKAFDPKLITTIRYGIENDLKYIEQNYVKLNKDCWLGVIFASAIIKDAYQNGTQAMDNSSLKVLRWCIDVLQIGIPTILSNKTWVVKYILDTNLWQRDIRYKYNTLNLLQKFPNVNILENIYKYQNLSNENPSSDFCLQDIINLTLTFTPTECYINRDCWKMYYDYNRPASGYILTHKLLLLQLARARRCLISDNNYAIKTNRLCSLIYAEVINADYYDVLDQMFDLFLEQVLLCGYEGYTEFFKTKWLIYILKSQKKSGCFPAFLGDPLKTRIKRNTNILPDGCADHTTGLGVAVLSLYYNFIIKGNIKDVN